MKLRISILVIWISALQIGFAQPWSQLQDYPGNAVDDGVSFSIGNSAFFGTGLTNWFASKGDFYKFNLNDFTWQAIADMPLGEERQYATGFSNSSFGFVFGGYNGSNGLNDLWKYDPQNDSWKQKASLPAKGRWGSAVITLADTAYVIGGKTDSLSSISEVWAYALNFDTWTQKSNLPFGPRFRASGMSKTQNGYVAFGVNDSATLSDKIFEYSPSNDSWTLLTQFPAGPRYYAMCQSFITNPTLLMGLGQDSTGALKNDLWYFDLGNNTWEQANDLPASGRRGVMSVSSLSYTVITTGLDSSFNRTKETWLFANPIGLTEEGRLDISIYPNPTNGIVTIEGEGLENGEFQYEVLSLTGKVLKRSVVKEKKQEIDLGTFPKGLYLVKVFNRRAQHISKVQLY